MSETATPHLDRACELLWQAGHPRIAEALEAEVRELQARSDRFEAVLYPKIVKTEEDEDDVT